MADLLMPQNLPGERTPLDVISRQVSRLAGPQHLHLTQLFAPVADVILILNRQQQVVFYHSQQDTWLGIHPSGAIYGLRIGEILRCSQAFEAPRGCGTGDVCQDCGALKAIQAAERGERASEDCAIVQRTSGEAFDLRIRTAPLPLDNDRFTIVAIADISDETRRVWLERIFFHDVMNKVAAVHGYAELLCMNSPDAEQPHRLLDTTRQLIQEIHGQRDLVAAENNEIVTRAESFDSLPFLRQVIDGFAMHVQAQGTALQLAADAASVTLHTDRMVLGRVVGNMVKNALEASASGDTVTVGCRLEGDRIRIWVHNPAVIPREIQHSLFKRVVSSKGPSRGLGTYSMKLLSERYLKGRVAFVSTPHEGTTFSALLSTIRGAGLMGAHEQLAQAIHEQYLQLQQQAGQTLATNASLLPWDELPARLKEENRRYADHIDLKLRSIGCEARPQLEFASAPATLTDAEIEFLAEMEHRRWCDERVQEGWTYHPGTKDLPHKTSPHLVPWSALTDDMRAYNRDLVRNLPELLGAWGFRICRQTDAEA